MLSHDDLKPHYGKVTWLFVTRNFKDDANDREAARVHDRFGVTSWPHCVLFDPRDDRVLADLPRDLAGFVRGLDRWRAAVPAVKAARAAADRIERAIALHGEGEVDEALRIVDDVAEARDEAGVWLHARELAREWRTAPADLAAMLVDPEVRQRALALESLLDGAADRSGKHRDRTCAILIDRDEHLVVRLRALRLVAANEPEFVAEHAEKLLEVDSDPFRFIVLTALATSSTPGLTPVLLRLFEGAGDAVPSRNPNVLRIHVARCLGASGDERAIAPLAAVARAADLRNGLTGASVDALGAIAERGPASLRQRVIGILVESLPAAADESDNAVEKWRERATVGACRRIHAVLEKIAASVPALPNGWTAIDRERFVAELESVRARG
ncbi:MAG: hypothetical protein KDE27_23690 [Planctomycetes bacterium]|nr:hypothetical protein [Planctomycetota bacterium]